MDELLEQFLMEGRDLVAEGNAALDRLRSDGANAAAIDSAFRAFHTLKGSVGIFAMAPAERVLHAAEDVLAQARSGGTGLDAATIDRLLMTLDQIDRWIDEAERLDGRLGDDADRLAAELLEGGASANHAAQVEAHPEPGTPAWLSALTARHAATIASSAAPLNAFRYTPDGDAFFRGEDPVALMAGVPDLLAFDILPSAGEWPKADALEPFACIMVIEGLTAATPEALAPAVRLVRDQVTILPVEHDRLPGADSPSDDARPDNSVLRVDAQRVDRLADEVGELVIATHTLAALADRADNVDHQLGLGLRAAQADLERAVGAISRSVSAVRMVSLAPALRRLPRLVREIAAGLDKLVSFTMTGDHLQVDKQIADRLFEPLLHLVRNALDHGLETAADRLQRGKPETGNLRLAIARQGDEIVVTLTDDGAGIDRTRVRNVAVERGLIARDAANGLSDAGTLGLLFAPGFSTAAGVTGVSGRGVGMDAVRATTARLRGRIAIDSTLGVGTTITLRLPANAITTRLLVVAVGRDRYAVPFDQISETVRVPGDRLIPVGTGTACVLRDRTVPVLSLAELLGEADPGTLPARLLVTRAGGDPVALRVDGFHDRLDAMVRAPVGLLANMKLVGGTTVMGDGAVMLVLNLAELVA